MMKIIALTTAIFGLALGNADNCVLLTQAINTAATGTGTCTPAIHQCVNGENLCVDADCVLGAANDPGTECTASCELLTQVINTAATGTGTCAPATHQCVDGENACVVADCVLGAANDPNAECTPSCELLTQVIDTAATGTGTCAPATHQCVDGEYGCSDADCVLGAANDPSTECTASCELLTQVIDTAATGTGTCTPATHQCVNGENACVVADCVLGAANDPSTECTASCELLTQVIDTAATGTGTCTPATHQCVNGENACVDADCVLGAANDPSTECGVADTTTAASGGVADTTTAASGGVADTTTAASGGVADTTTAASGGVADTTTAASGGVADTTTAASGNEGGNSAASSLVASTVIIVAALIA